MRLAIGDLFVQPDTVVRWHRTAWTLLDVEEYAPCWPAAHPGRGKSTHREDGRREFALGQRSHPGRTSLAWLHSNSVFVTPRSSAAVAP